MIYRVVHVTEYQYAEPVSTSHHQLFLSPRPALNQTTDAETITITPQPVARRERVDSFGNRCTHIEMQAPHRQLHVESRFNVDVRAPAAPPMSSPPWEEVRDCLRRPRTPALLDACGFSFESPQVQLLPQARVYAQESFTPGRPLIEALLDLTQRIHGEFTYDSRATTVSTPVAQVMSHRRGVCQDFAHLQIACLRTLGLAARYVSGYLMTTPPPGRPRLVGADASHAWLSVYNSHSGWIDVDPTNNVIPSDHHITVAWGRDFSDVTPMRGVILGGGAHDVRVAVDVVPTTTAETATALS
ncbi:MAG TPA: transglutaminase family protein [Polyangia bacterium]|nr:transglutaminase family protein [Polyangia bacterium]